MNDFKERIIAFLKSRIFPLFLIMAFLMGVVIARIFSLQIVHGEEYVDNFSLTAQKTRDIKATRGNIYDRNGVLLAYNDLSYSVAMSDVVASGKNKNQTLNSIILRTVQILESNHDSLSCVFNIYLDDDDNYCFAVEGSQLSRFLADIYGEKNFNDLTYEQKNANPDQIIDYLISSKKFGVGTVLTDQNGETSFAPGMGYTKKEILSICNIRYNLSLNGYQKYLTTTIAKDISDESVAAIMENCNLLDGVSIQEDTVRRYNYPQYFSAIIGYTGQISQAEYDTYVQTNPNYSLNDMVGKTGIEYSMESYLQGTKGSETFYVDNLGKVIETTNIISPVAGNDIYLTIDAKLQMALYRLLEQKIAGIILVNLENAKVAKDEGRSTGIAIYEVYETLFTNNVIDIKRLSKDFAGETEKAVYSRFLSYQESIIDKLRNEMLNGNTKYNKLSTEMQVYESYIVNYIGSSNVGVLKKGEIDASDPVYKNWREDENISIKEFLLYAISQNWIDISKLKLESDYADSSEIYASLVEYVLEKLVNNSEFSKKLYKYMIYNGVISPQEVCILLWEQDVVQISNAEINALKSGRITPYSFMYSLIENLKLTPAQLALEPCSGSIVVANVNTGEPLAIVSYPGYDNNRLSGNADAAYLAKLNEDNSKPLWNYATQQRTAPGSTFKMLSAIAGLEEGVIDLYSQIQCTGQFDKLTGSIHKCWAYPGSHGKLNVTGGIANSCNNFFYEVGYRLAYDGNGYNDPYGISRLYKYADMFGLSEKSGVEITESEPNVSDQYPVVSAIGQGTNNFTTVGLSRYVTAVANGGTVYTYSLINKIQDASGSIIKVYVPQVRNEVIISVDKWNAIHKGMREVCEKKTYFNSFPIRVAGKTGTAQEATNKPNHALFVCYAPYDTPAISTTIRIANGYSSEYAAQLGRDVLSYYFQVQPEEELITGKATSTSNAASNGD